MCALQHSSQRVLAGPMKDIDQFFKVVLRSGRTKRWVQETSNDDIAENGRP